MTNQSFTIFLIGVLMIGLAGCNATKPSTQQPTDTPQPTATSSNVAKTRWLNAEPCGPPCYEGIIPGESTFEEAVELIESNTLIDPDSIIMTMGCKCKASSGLSVVGGA